MSTKQKVFLLLPLSLAGLAVLILLAVLLSGHEYVSAPAEACNDPIPTIPAPPPCDDPPGQERCPSGGACSPGGPGPGLPGGGGGPPSPGGCPGCIIGVG